MWSPPTAIRGLEDGSVPYGRALPRRSKPHRVSDAAPGYHPSPLRHPSSASAVPFSWEHRPGIPKPSAGGVTLPSRTAVLPLPPPHRSASSLKIKHRHTAVAASAAQDDPFAAALAECAKAPPGPDIDELFARRGLPGGRARRLRRPSASSSSSSSWSASDRIGLFGLLHASSCKATCAVADSTVFVPRSGSRPAS